MAVEGRSGIHSVVVASTATTIVTIMLLFAAILSPGLSPVATIADWDGDGHSNANDAFPRDHYEWTDTDGDGVGDNSDVFPNDSTQTTDSDGDGIGDERDFCDGGNGGVRISLNSFAFTGYVGGTYQLRKIPNPMFKVLVDRDNNGDYEWVNQTMLNASAVLYDFFNCTVDLPDSAVAITFTIIVYDVIDLDAGKIEMIDYWPFVDIRYVAHNVSLPCCQSWISSGVGDADSPDCELAYRIDTVLIPG